jgi:hypothetical protein
MAEPRHMLLGLGSWLAAPSGVVLGSLCLGIATLLKSAQKARRIP